MLVSYVSCLFALYDNSDTSCTFSVTVKSFIKCVSCCSSLVPLEARFLQSTAPSKHSYFPQSCDTACTWPSSHTHCLQHNKHTASPHPSPRVGVLGPEHTLLCVQMCILVTPQVCVCVCVFVCGCMCTPIT